MVTDITDKLERERELVRLNEEINAAMEEMEAVNEEFEAQNREMALAMHNLEESEDRFRSIADNLMDGITVIEGGRAIYVNKRMTEILGYSREELLAMPRFHFAAPEEIERVLAIHQKAIKEQRAPGPISFWIIRKDGERRFVQNRYRIRFHEDGNITWFAVTTDLTDEIKAEEERKRLITAIEQSEEDIIITDTDGIINYVNPAFERNTGYTREEALGNSPSILKSGHHDDSFYEQLWQRLGSGRVWSGRIINRKKNGQLMVQSGTVSPIRDRNNEITGYVSIKRDVTSESRLEDQLVQAQKMEAIGTLAGGLAHDFNNLLGGILGAANLIDLAMKKDGPKKEEKIRGFLETIQASSRRAADMIRQLLTLSRKDDATYVPLDLNSSLRHIEKLAKNSFPKSVTLEFRYREEPVIIHADPTQIEQVILNICLNSSHAMTIMRGPDEKQGGTLTVELEKCLPGSPCVQAFAGIGDNEPLALIRIQDTGVGMDEETRAHAFDPFFTTKEGDEGTGLGLAMAYTIVKRHAGTIEIESEPSRGTTVSILLPVDEETREPLRSEDRDELVPGSGHLLVIDDETIVLSVTSGILEECGYRVTGTREAKQGIEFFRENHGELEAVVLDMSMPHVSGLDVFRELKTIDERVPILIVSGYAQDERVQKVLDEGATSFLQKPYNSRSLSESVAKVIREHPSR
jgi:PAS domain S-box-containing protein